MAHQKIRILFDANPLLNQKKSGVGYYTYNLIESLARQHADEIELIGYYFGQSPAQITLPNYENITYKSIKWFHPKILSVMRRLGFQPPIELFIRDRFDLLLGTNFVLLPSVRNTSSIVTVHDLAYLEQPEYVSAANRRFLERFVPRSIKQSSAIITISNSSRSAIAKYYKVPLEKITITPIPPINPQKSAEKIDIEGKYILFVGTIEPRKNITNLLEAYTLLPKDLQDEFSLVLAGGDGWNNDQINNQIELLQSRGFKIITPGYVSDLKKIALYQNASLLVQPSHYEGFGMPILEAMSYGLPVAASNIPVFHEAGGDAVEFFNKDDPEDIAHVIYNLLRDSAQRKLLSQRSLEHVKQFSWIKVAQQVHKVAVSLVYGRS